MKAQYLGDSKDSFKWHYHDYLAREMGFPLLNIAFMRTPDDKTNHGKSDPSLFPARDEIGDEIIEFCNVLQKKKCFDEVRRLPDVTGAKYKIEFHNDNGEFKNQERERYFSGFSDKEKQLVFLDPDTGFEPKNRSKKHVRYSDIKSILKLISNDSVISVFQHFRRKKFEEDFAEIKDHLISGCATGIWWRHYVMFVAIGKSQKVIAQVRKANKKYSKTIQPKLESKGHVSLIF